MQWGPFLFFYTSPSLYPLHLAEEAGPYCLSVKAYGHQWCLGYESRSPNYLHLLEEVGSFQEDPFRFSLSLLDSLFTMLGSTPEETEAPAPVSASASSPVGSSEGVSSSGAPSSESLQFCSSPDPSSPVKLFDPYVTPIKTPLAHQLSTPESIKDFGLSPSKPVPPSLIEAFERIYASGSKPPFQREALFLVTSSVMTIFALLILLLLKLLTCSIALYSRLGLTLSL